MERAQEGRCKGCGSALPHEPSRRGRKRLWCTDNCRKRTWEREVEERAVCRDCGDTLGSAPRKGSERCRPCYFKHAAAEHEAILAFVEWMWHEGRPLREIAQELGRKSGAWSVGPELNELRRTGRIGYRYKAYESRATAQRVAA